MALPTRPILRALWLAVILTLAGATVQAQVPYADETLAAFVDAAIKVEALMEKRDSAIQKAPSEVDAERIREEAVAEMADAVEGTPGISVDEYLEINRVSRQDPALMERILRIYGHKVHGAPPPP